jgi:Cu(I)/Ag(I) efflux system protein CusF
MSSRCLRFLLVGLAPIAVAACLEIDPATSSPIPTAPLTGVDLGGSGRVPQIAGLAGEGEGYGRTEPGVTLSEHGPIPGMGQASMGHESMGGKGDTSMPGMSHGSQQQMVPGRGAMPGKDHSTRHNMRMAHSGHAHVQGTGTVNSVDAAARKVNVSHGSIPKIGWPAMTMDFAVAVSVDLSGVKPGTRVRFDMEQGQDGSYVIQSIAPAGGRQ